MSERRDTFSRIEEGGVIAVLRSVADDTLEPIARAIVAGGITAVEVTADTPDVTGKIRRLRDVIDETTAVVGAGTVLDAPTARDVHLAGAQFLVTPTVSNDVIQTANRYGLPVIPGIMTPTEAQEALEAGADAVKLFPAATVGPDHIGAIHGPLGQIPIVPTGGIDLENATAYMNAGAVAVGTGSALLTDEILKTRDWDALEDRASEFVEAVNEGRE